MKLVVAIRLRHQKRTSFLAKSPSGRFIGPKRQAERFETREEAEAAALTVSHRDLVSTTVEEV